MCLSEAIYTNIYWIIFLKLLYIIDKARDAEEEQLTVQMF
jgi:hypothetical protein